MIVYGEIPQSKMLTFNTEKNKVPLRKHLQEIKPWLKKFVQFVKETQNLLNAGKLIKLANSTNLIAISGQIFIIKHTSR